jgi:hypothetical protein
VKVRMKTSVLFVTFEAQRAHHSWPLGLCLLVTSAEMWGVPFLFQGHSRQSGHKKEGRQANQTRCVLGRNTQSPEGTGGCVGTGSRVTSAVLVSLL